MKCVYCGSSAYGKGCLYSPTQIHVHADSQNSCMYCGSQALGTGCLYNPYGKVHVRPATVFIQMKEQLEKTGLLSYFIMLIEQNNDKKYRSPLDRFYKRISESFKRMREPFLQSLVIQSQKVILENLEDQQNMDLVHLEERLTEQLSDIKKTLKFANYSFPPEKVEKILTGAILKNINGN